LFRGTWDKSNRTASGYNTATSIGLQADEAERDVTVLGGEVELMPNAKTTLTLAYARRNEDYPNRPNRAPGVEGTSNGLLKSDYDTYTIELGYTVSERADVGGFYTYEKSLSSTRYGGTGSAAAAPYTPLISMLTFDGSNKVNTYGAYATFVVVPEKWSFDFNTQRAKLDGLMDVIGDSRGSFALARVSYGGIKPINDYNDSDWTTISAQLRYTVTKSLDMSLGYAYDKFIFKDAYSIFGNQDDAGVFDPGGEVFPASGGFYLKANDGDYKVNIVYTKLHYRF